MELRGPLLMVNWIVSERSPQNHERTTVLPTEISI